MTARERFLQLASRPGEDDLAEAALLLATLEYPALDVAPPLALLEQLAEEAAQRVQHDAAGGDVLEHLQAFGRYLFDEQGFSGNLADYDNCDTLLVFADEEVLTFLREQLVLPVSEMEPLPVSANSGSASQV